MAQKKRMPAPGVDGTGKAASGDKAFYPNGSNAPIKFDGWLNELHPKIISRILHGPSDPDSNIQYIYNLSPDEILEALTDPQLLGLFVDKDTEDENVRRLMRKAAWLRHAQQNDMLPEELNDHKFVRHYGNKPMVMHWNVNGDLVLQTVHEFKNSHLDRYMLVTDEQTGELKQVPLAPAWLKASTTPRYDRVEFLPGVEEADMPDGALNLWRGWPLRTDETDDSPGEPPACDLFLEHVRENVCGGDIHTYEYLTGWMADAVNNPHRTSEVAVVLQGPQGSGKTLFANSFMEFFAPHTLVLDKPNQVTGNFNRHLQDKSVVFADEAFFAGNKQHAATLKTLVTGDKIFIEPKGVDGFMAPKLFRLIIASNDEHVIRAEIDDRRYLVLNVDAKQHNQSGEYFGNIVNQWQNGGRTALFRWLRGAYWRKTIENGIWDVRQRPQTRALLLQKDMSLSPALLAIHNMLMEGEPPCDFVARQPLMFVPTGLFSERSKLTTGEQREVAKAFAALAGQTNPSKREYVGEDSRRRQLRGFWLPPLDICRERWEEYLSRRVEWPANVKTWGLEQAGNHCGDDCREDKAPF